MATVNAPVPADPRMDSRIAEETGAGTPASPKRGGLGGSVWWRHALGILALMWALFPILFIYSAATNPSGTLNTASLWPSGFSTKNFTDLFNDRLAPVLDLVQELDDHLVRRGARGGLPRRVRGVRLLAPAVQGPSRRDDVPAADDVLPGAARHRRDVHHLRGHR